MYAPEMASEMKKLYDAGVLVNMGAHGQMLGLDAHWELELFVQGILTNGSPGGSHHQRSGVSWN